MKYTIHKRSEQKVVGGFDHKADAVNAITGLIDAAKVTDDWQDGDYMTVRGDGHILSYLPAQRVTKDEFGNSFTSPATPEDILTDILREQGKADIKVLESETELDPIVVTAAIQKLVADGTAVQFTGTNEDGNPIPVWRLA